MIEKMKFISIIGPKAEIDRVASEYLCRYEIQLENTLSELKELKNITPCAESNPYRDVKVRADELAARLTDGTQRSQTYDRMDAGQAVSLIEELWKELDVCKKAKGSLEEERKKVIDLPEPAL